MGQDNDVIRVAAAMRAITPDTLEKLKACTYEIDHNPGSAVYVPMACFFSEDLIAPHGADAGDKTPAVGVRKSLALKSVDAMTYGNFDMMTSMAQKTDASLHTFMAMILKGMVKGVARGFKGC